MKSLILLSFISFSLGCTNSFKGITSFSERKYNKGFFVDIPNKTPKTSEKAIKIVVNDSLIQTNYSNAYISQKEHYVNKNNIQSILFKPSDIQIKRLLPNINLKPRLTSKNNYNLLPETNNQIAIAFQTTDDNTPKPTKWGLVAFIFLLLALLIFLLGLITMLLSANGLGVLFGFFVISLIPFLISLILSSIALCQKRDNHTLAMVSLIGSMLFILLFLLVFSF